ncbi:MAG: thioredoxin fold domain-containing protein [Desulfobacterales bacterium]|nr:thioredoxin fold domain-containing protein [Desulfobacterales bacterium]
MKKENILVVALVAIALGGIYLFNAMDSGGRGGSDAQTLAVAAQEKTEGASAGGTMSPAGEYSGIGWKDYTPGMALARKENKSIFLYFHAPWCTYCTKLKKTTFRDKQVLAYLEENFISIQVNTDENQALANQWRVKGLPTMWFLESDGGKIDSMPGYVEAGRLLQILKYIHTKSYTDMEFNEFVKQG